MKNISIYVHIPFCSSKCFYCDFNSYVNKEDLICKYIDALCYEIISNTDILTSYNITSIYFGGGTPSFIDEKYIVKIMNILNMYNIDKNVEITLEANPNSLTEQKIKAYEKIGINRISLGLQTTYDDILKKIGRKHTKKDFLTALELVKKSNIKNISCDLIYPLPDLDLKRFKSSIDELIKISNYYNIKHISVYNLEVHENTKLAFLLNEGFLTLVDEQEEYEMRNYLHTTLEKYGFLKYEISNFALPGFESKHNLNYWNQGIYLGFGAFASSFFSGSRYTNLKDIDKYIDSVINNLTIIQDKEDLDLFDLIKEYCILRLRLKEGILFSDFQKRFGKSIFDYFKSELTKLQQDGLIIITDTNIFLSDRGEEVANLVWEKFV